MKDYLALLFALYFFYSINFFFLNASCNSSTDYMIHRSFSA